MMFGRHTLALALLVVLAAGAPAWADESVASAAAKNTAGALNPRETWFLIIVGHSGDREYEKEFSDVADRLRRVAHDRLGIAEERIWTWSGVKDPTAEQEPAAEKSATRGPAKRETLKRDLAELRSRCGENSELWVVILSHAHPQGKAAQLNLPGSDVDSEEFASWFEKYPCRRSVFFLTHSQGGQFLESLSAPGRVIIAAAGKDEINETLFPLALANQLETLDTGAESGASAAPVTLLDVYLAVARDVSARYETDELLPTEHAQLDDNGDRRGTELQTTQDRPAARSPRGPGGEPARPEGDLASKIVIKLAPPAK
jgi:hypothetical protein